MVKGVKLSSVEVKEEENRIKRVLLDITEAIHRKDLDAYMEGYHDDAIVLMHSGTPLIKGKEPWRKMMTEAIPVLISITYDEIIVKASEVGDFGYCIGDFRVVEKAPEGQIEFREKLHATFMKKGDEWKIMAISFCR